MVYSAPLTVPGDFILNIHNRNLDASQHIRQLREKVHAFIPIPTSQHSPVPTLVPPKLQQAKFVFLRQDDHSTRLQRPYEDHFKVIQL